MVGDDLLFVAKKMGAARLVAESVYKVHDAVDSRVHEPDYQCDNDGSDEHDNRAFDQLPFSWPRSLIAKFVIRLLDIRE